MRQYGYGVTDKALEHLIRDVLQRRAPERAALIDLVGQRSLTQDEREGMREILSDELAEHGLGPGDEPNDRGQMIEAAIAWLGRK